jgi:hypothetical protein
MIYIIRLNNEALQCRGDLDEATGKLAKCEGSLITPADEGNDNTSQCVQAEMKEPKRVEGTAPER